MNAPVVESARSAALDLTLVRAVPFATVCVLLGVGGHLIGSGAGIPLGAVLFGWLLALAAAIRAARRERSLRAITAGLAGGQLALHLLFQLAQAIRQAPPAGATGGMLGMPGMSGMPGASGSGVAPGALWHHAVLGLSPAMLLGHLLATVVAGWWLRRGEAAVWRLVSSTSRAAAAAARRCAGAARTVLALIEARAAVPEPAGARFVPADPPPGAPGRAVLRHSLARRGPPVVPVH
ncbi:hypothetical protein [Kitasatospora viridis]|uniref:Uncharacterized protein n=1 Tax=Kitasatospora viridis TaxID=281105 RepID=A0A561TTK8_9ACTN|nr:hypothetical protein [Kitasatospora viridis]TWF90459.1 hypothetical protein FHX73_13506 [Kitasatospora viridis]